MNKENGKVICSEEYEGQICLLLRHNTVQVVEESILGKLDWEEVKTKSKRTNNIN